MGLGLRMPDYVSFIRSVRIRYISGLLIFALATGAAIFALNRINFFRHDVDAVSGNLVELTKDLHNATHFAETASDNWRAIFLSELTSVARDYANRISTRIDMLSEQIDVLKPHLSKETRDLLSSSSINGDLFWSAKDMVRNLNLMAAATTLDNWSAGPIRNQNDLFVQPMLIKARTAMDAERHLADGRNDRLLLWASGILCLVIGIVAFWIFRPMEKAIRMASRNRTIGWTMRHRPTHIGFSWPPITTRVICSPIMVAIAAIIS